MVASLSQLVEKGDGSTAVNGSSYQLDPQGRVGVAVNTSANTETSRLRYRYSDATDSPSSIDASYDAGANWTSTRYIAALGLGMIASISNGRTTWQLANLHGDVVATQEAANSVDAYAEADEYGNLTNSAEGKRYGWLGTYQRSTAAVGGVILMGARIFNPVVGAFLTADPVLGGNVTKYTYPQDPINFADLDGRHWEGYYGGWKYYKVRGPNYVRIWLNKRALLALARVAGTSGWLAEANGVVRGVVAALRAAGIVTGGLSAVIGAILSALWIFIGFTFESVAKGLRYLVKRRRGLGIRQFFVKGVPVAQYPYISEYAYSVGM